MQKEHYGPLAFLIGKWSNGEDWSGENRAPNPYREVENTNFRQEITFEPIGDVNNHEQTLYGLRYFTQAWEEDGGQQPFHQEVGYWLWDAENKIIMKSFIVPRGIAVNAGGTADKDATTFELKAEVGDPVYGISSNPFLDKEFKSVRYDLKIEQIDEDTLRYDEDTQILIKGQTEVFHHTEKNILKRV